ncbi:Solute carrier family 25 member 44 [Trichinella pseudospiralis]|uniref:Solute carrier family 25 member 44 n=1 Tax=Trichinella pseudospiralis TaxID=6337 RepID=A0A0V1FAK5_TRIPS|nr:Solute carrier family 25 member 44 [Trichinella pseudospiralis]
MEPVDISTVLDSKGFKVIEWHMLDLTKYVCLNTASSLTIRSLVYPLTVVKTRMQIERSTFAGMGAMGTFRHILANEGCRALYRGFVPNTLQMTSAMTYLMLYEKIRERLAEHGVAGNHLRAFIAGAGATAGAQLILVPLDVISQHMMVAHVLSKKNPLDVDTSILKSPLNLKLQGAKGSLSYLVCKEIYKRDGFFRGFYRGYFASLLCYAPSSALFWSIYHALSDGICKKVDSAVPQIVVNGFAAPVASLVATVLTNSLDVFRTNLQVHGTKWCETVLKLWRAERFGIFTMGLTARISSTCISSFFFITMYEYVKHLSVQKDFQSQIRCVLLIVSCCRAPAGVGGKISSQLAAGSFHTAKVTMGCVPSRQFDSNAKSHSFSVTAKLSTGKTVRGSIEVSAYGISFHQRTALIIQCPWHHVRCYGFCDDFFRFESGRRCEFGPGVYTFQCSRASELFCQVQRIIFETASTVYNEADRFDAYTASSSVQRCTSSDFLGNRADFSRINRVDRFANSNTIRLMNDFSEFSELHIPTQRNARFIDVRPNTTAVQSTNNQSHYINVYPANQAANPVEQVAANQDRRRFFQFLGRSGSSRTKSRNAERPAPPQATLMPALEPPVQALAVAAEPEPEPTPTLTVCSLSGGGSGQQQKPAATAKAEDRAYDMSALNYVTLEMSSSASSSSNVQMPTTARTFGEASTGAGTSSTNYAVIDSTKTKALHHTTSTLHSRKPDEYKALRRGRFASSTDSYGR